jgi:HrpA-like RNA helicase
MLRVDDVKADSYLVEEDEKDFDVLPVVEYKREIIDCIKENRVIIVISETGSGKTTQIPQFCADCESFSRLKIAVTQPRRVAAITVA